MSMLITSLQMPELNGIRNDEIQQVLPKLINFTIKGANAQLKDQNKWYVNISKVTPFCDGGGPFIVRLNIEVNVDDNSSLSNIEMTNIIDKTILGHWDFNVDEMKKK